MVLMVWQSQPADWSCCYLILLLHALWDFLEKSASLPPRGRAQLEILCLTQLGIFLCVFINDDLIISIGFVISYILAKISCRKSVGGSLTESVLDIVGVQS